MSFKGEMKFKTVSPKTQYEKQCQQMGMVTMEREDGLRVIAHISYIPLNARKKENELDR